MRLTSRVEAPGPQFVTFLRNAFKSSLDSKKFLCCEMRGRKEGTALILIPHTYRDLIIFGFFRQVSEISMIFEHLFSKFNWHAEAWRVHVVMNYPLVPIAFRAQERNSSNFIPTISNPRFLLNPVSGAKSPEYRSSSLSPIFHFPLWSAIVYQAREGSFHSWRPYFKWGGG